MASAASPQRLVRSLLMALDTAIILAAVGAAPLERVGLEQWLPLREVPAFGLLRTEYTALVVLTVPIWVGLAARLDLYAVFERAWSYGELAKRIVNLHLLGFVALATLLYATQLVVNRSLVALFMINSIVAMFIARACLVAWAHYRYRRGLGRRRLLLVGDPAGPLAAFAARAVDTGFAPCIVGYLAPNDTQESDLAWLGDVPDIERVLHETPIDQVLFFRPYSHAETLEQALLACDTVGVPAWLAVDVGLPPGKAPDIQLSSDHPFVSLESAPQRSDLLAIKHLFDFVAGLVGLVLLAPLLLVVALLVMLTMGRPVLYAQDRAGYRGRPFRMLKFRTMVDDAERLKADLLAKNEMSGPVFKLTDDPRITKLGRILRKTSLDELPQLLHVVSGTMSIVGPRPLPLAEQQKIHGWHRRRLAMRPGITGLWQVSGRSDTTFERWMELDLDYVDRWSLRLDLEILLRTVPVVLLQRGAR